ncbi:protein windpipe [Hylaeus volcanicus]|uniref:protein windpipe n=1 Tax=Hylaeus volcanicus TaxID=313075 RepID=UPI0023B8333E|nr:protein windpipe [Hylaeus volcanicus]
MQTAQFLPSLLLIVLSCSGLANGLCHLENGTVARCQELNDVKSIDIQVDLLDTLEARVLESVLRPGLLENLTSLRHLDLSGGSLKRIEPGSFQHLDNLRSLSLAENRIGRLEFNSTDGLKHLHSLNLRKNNFHQLPSGLDQLKALKHLDIHGNPLQCNCATLRARDSLIDRGVKISKKILCVGPSTMKGTSLFKPNATVICNFEEQDHEMMRDQSYVEPADVGSGDGSDTLDEEEEEDGWHSFKSMSESSEAPEESPAETPFPEPDEPSTSASTTTESTSSASITSEASQEVTICSPQDSNCLEKPSEKDEDIVFYTDEKTSSRTKSFTDALFQPDEGSGDEDEASGEGSGTGAISTDWKKTDADDGNTEKEEEEEEEGTFFGMLQTLRNVFWSTTEAIETKKDLDLAEEQFIDASATKEADEKVIVPTKIGLDEAIPESSTEKVDPGVDLMTGELDDMSKSGDVKVKDENLNEEMAEVSPAKQSKKGMGSYVVLAALLGILATLIVFAAYKGDFCKKKRKRGDVENGTEMKDMQKALLDTGNAPQPKIASNGTVESFPLVEDAIDHESRARPNNLNVAPKSLNGSMDCIEPVKPPRKINDISGLDVDSLQTESARGSPEDQPVDQSAQSSAANGPPLSPGAQRVKITMQENPDSVPKTPILITRTMAGENLVKTP